MEKPKESLDKDVPKKEFQNENAEENLSKKTPVEGASMEEKKKDTPDDKELEED